MKRSQIQISLHQRKLHDFSMPSSPSILSSTHLFQLLARQCCLRPLCIETCAAAFLSFFFFFTSHPLKLLSFLYPPPPPPNILSHYYIPLFCIPLFSEFSTKKSPLTRSRFIIFRLLSKASSLQAKLALDIHDIHST